MKLPFLPGRALSGWVPTSGMVSSRLSPGTFSNLLERDLFFRKCVLRCSEVGDLPGAGVGKQTGFPQFLE